MGVDDVASQESSEDEDEHPGEPDEDMRKEPAEAEREPVPSGLARFIVG